MTFLYCSVLALCLVFLNFHSSYLLNVMISKSLSFSSIISGHSEQFPLSAMPTSCFPLWVIIFDHKFIFSRVCFPCESLKAWVMKVVLSLSLEVSLVLV